MLSALNRKLLRDLLHARGQAFAIALVLACGVGTFVMSLSSLDSLQQAQRSYYDEYRFAHIFAHVKRAPATLAPRIAEIPGVAQVQTRILAEVNLDLPGMAEPAIGRLISIPERREPMLNDLHLRQGRWIEPGRRGEVLVSEPFAQAHGFVPGDAIRAVINGRLRTLTIAGIAISPEFIYEIREGDMLPDNRRFGIFWMAEPELAAAFDLDGAFNSIALTLLPRANPLDIIDRLDQLTERYGGLGAYDRADQVSHRLIEGELEQLRAMAVIIPIIFFIVAAFLLNMVLSRMISAQRQQIAALKAFGYTRWEIGLHYLQFVTLIALLGVAIGVAAGAFFGSRMALLYAEFFRFPTYDYLLSTTVLAPTCFISLAVAALSALRAVQRAATLPPAEAMRPEPPPNYRATIVERIGLQTFLSQTARMVLRQLERQPLRAALTTLGIALAVSVLVLGNFTQDVIDYAFDLEFSRTQRQDVTVTFHEPRTSRALREVERMPGVLIAEPFRAIPARLRAAHRTERTAIFGLPAQRDLTRLLDANDQSVDIPAHGILLSDKLAELLDVSLGDVITVEVLEQDRPVRQTTVTGIVRMFSGMSAWMQIDTARALMREADTASGAHLAVDAEHLDALYTTLKETPGVAGVSIKLAAIRSFEEIIAENILRIRLFNMVFAGIIAFGVVYNAARITLAERAHELATLRVIGFTRREVSTILLGELMLLTLIAIPLGLFIGHAFASIAIVALETDDHRFPLVIYPATYASAVIVVLLATIASGLYVRRRIDHLDMVAVLKTGT